MKVPMQMICNYMLDGLLSIPDNPFTLKQLAHSTWLTRATAFILVGAFGMQWVLSHVVALGASALGQNSDTSLFKAVSELIQSHKDCQVCVLLNEEQQKEGRSPLNISLELLNIEFVVDRRALILEANVFHQTQILLVDSLNRPSNPFQRKKPPKATA